MGKHEQEQLEKMSRILGSLSDKASYCNIHGLSDNIATFTDTLSSIERSNLDRYQNDALIAITEEYIATITRLEHNCILTER